MKKYCLFILSLIAYANSFAQAPRTVLLEWFTSTGCGPCTFQGPRMDSLNHHNPTSKLITLEYHGNYGNIDPMYFHNPTEPVSRFSYYGHSGYPSANIDGNFYNGHPSQVNQNKVNTRSAVTSPFIIDLSYVINNDGKIDVSAKAKAVQATSGTFVMHIAIVEKYIITRKVERNGETHWTNVMKKMLPNQNGSALPATWSVNDSTFIYQSWKMQNIYNVDQIAVIAWIQNTATKEVMQAAFKDNALPYTITTNVADSVYTKFIGKGGTATYNFEVSINSDIADTYELSLVNNLPVGWTASFTVGGSTYTTPTDISFNAIETKSVTVSVSTSSNGNERGDVTLQVKSKTRIGMYKDQYPTYTFSSVSNLVSDKYEECDTSIMNTLASKGMNGVTITDYELEGLDTNGLSIATLDHLIYSTEGKNIFHGVSDKKLEVFENYMQSGGDILIISESMGAEIQNTSNYYGISPKYTSFYDQTIGASYLGKSVSSSNIKLSKHNSDTIYFNTDSTLLNGSLLYREWFSTKNGSLPTLIYQNDQNKIAACINQDLVTGSKLGYWAFSFRLMSKTDGYRGEILKNTIDWFDGLALGLEKGIDQFEFELFPNPSLGQVKLRLSENLYKTLQYRVLDVMGKELTPFTQIGETGSLVELDFSYLSPAIYFLELNDGTNRTTKRLIISN